MSEQHGPRNNRPSVGAEYESLPESGAIAECVPPVECFSRFDQSLGSSGSDIVPNYLEALVAALAVVLGIAFRISRMRCRRRILRFRNRPNLALSPFLADMIPSMLNSNLRFRPRPSWLDAIPKASRGEENYTFLQQA